MKKPSFSNEAVLKKIAALFPGVSALTPILGGEESQAFRFNSEGRSLVLRLNADPEGFAKDKFVFERFAGPNLPIPEVFEIGPFEDLFFCISQEMPGRTLEELDPAHISQLLAPTCGVWHAIAKSDLSGMGGYGRFNSQGTTTFPTWRSFLIGILDTAKHPWESVRSYAGTQLLQEWADAFYLLVASCPEERALVHGDFGSSNVLADRERITGVVDWSEALIGDPLYDVANIFFWRTWLPCMEQQARHFEANPVNVHNWEERLLCYQLRIGLSEVLASSLERRDKAVSWVIGRCRQIARAINGHARP